MQRPNSKMFVLVLVLASAFATAAVAGAATPEVAPVEKEVTMDKLPAAVQKTAKAATKDAVIETITEETKDGAVVYEVSSKIRGRVHDILIGADGTLLVVEDQVDMKALPAPVQATFKKSAGKGKIVLLESVTENGALTYYEAHVMTGKQESEVKVQPDGVLIPAEAKAAVTPAEAK
jgi:hypothetical protein